MLEDAPRRRFARHLVLPEVGEQGQETLLASSVLVVGAGGLGASASGFLAAMGVGTIGLVDADRVELSNLQRQILFETVDIGQLKVNAAKARLEECAPDSKIHTHAYRLDETNAETLVANYDMVVDATDNFTTRIALHDACFQAKKTLIYAAISGFAAQITTFKAYMGAPHPCLHCFMPGMPEREINCAQEGIIGALAGMIGSQQALEAVKELLGIGESLSGKIWRYELLSAQMKVSVIKRDETCNYCVDHKGG